MKVTVKTRNQVRTTLDQDLVSKQVRYVTAKGTWVAVTMLDGRSLQLESPVPGVACAEAQVKTSKKSFLEKLG